LEGVEVRFFEEEEDKLEMRDLEEEEANEEEELLEEESKLREDEEVEEEKEDLESEELVLLLFFIELSLIFNIFLITVKISFRLDSSA
jgi:hypothetical protein